MSELIKILPQLWWLFLMLFVTGWGIYFKKPIRNFLENARSFQLKRGQTELSLTHGTPTSSDQPKQLKASGDESAPAKTELEATESIKQLESKLEKKSEVSWIIRMIDAALIKHSREEVKEAFTHVEAEEPDAIERFNLKGLYFHLLYTLGDQSALHELEELAKQESAASKAYYWLGQSYESSGLYPKAATAYELSAQKETAGKKADSIIATARCLFKSGEKDAAFSRIMREIANTSSEAELANLYEGLASLYEMNKNMELRALAVEKALEYKPNDSRLHFTAGWSYSEGETVSSVLAMMHYRAVVFYDHNDAAALNNLGVQYGKLDMPIRAITSYKAAVKLNHTLAAANLAYNYLNAGFAEEAEKLVAEARAKEDVHANVGSAIAAIAQKKEAEEKALTTIINNAHEQQRFLRLFATAYFTEQPNAPTFNKEWILPEGQTVTISQTGSVIGATWTHGEQNRTLSGTVSNRAAKIYLSRKLTSYSSESSSGYAYLSDDGTTLHIMTFKDKGEPTFINWKAETHL